MHAAVVVAYFFDRRDGVLRAWVLKEEGTRGGFEMWCCVGGNPERLSDRDPIDTVRREWDEEMICT